MVFGGVLVIVGIVWTLQGVGVLPGSFMSGDIFWAFAGAIAVVLGGLMVLIGGRR